MPKEILIVIVSVLLISGCASTQFSTIGKEEYRLSKMSDACAIGAPSSVLSHLREESVKFCAGRKEVPIEIASSSEMGIPYIRCTSATLTFRCEFNKSNGAKQD